MRGVQAPRATPVRGWRNYRVAKSHSWLRAVVLSTLRVFDLRHATSCIIPRALRLRDQTVAKPSRNHLSSLPLPPPPLLCFRIRVSAWDTCVRACTYARVIARTWKSTSRVLSSLFLPSFLPFSLPVFNFFNSATQGGGKLISITKHDRLVCTGFLSGIYGVRFLKKKETDRRIFHELVSPPQNRKERNTRNPHLIELDFWIHRQGFFFTLIGAFGKKERAGKEKEERENWIAAFRKLEIATK